MQRQLHPIGPLCDADSRVLILGSFPSVASRKERFFYAHPQNRFWRVISAVLGCPVPVTVQEKSDMLRAHRLALWDVIESCDIEGSSDASIRNVIPNDLGRILGSAPVKTVFTNGGTAHRLYKQYCLPQTQLQDICLPSTSPANARFSLPMLVQSWLDVANALND